MANGSFVLFIIRVLYIQNIDLIALFLSILRKTKDIKRHTVMQFVAEGMYERFP